MPFNWRSLYEAFAPKPHAPERLAPARPPLRASILDALSFPLGQPEAEELVRVMATLYDERSEALRLARRHKVEVTLLRDNLPPIDLWEELLKQVAKHGRTRAMVEEARNRYAANATACSFFDALLQGRPFARSTISEGDQYEYLNRFDRNRERDHLGQRLVKYSIPPSLSPIVFTIFAERADEYMYFLDRINDDLLKRWTKTKWRSGRPLKWTAATEGYEIGAEYEIRKIAGAKLGKEGGEISKLLASLAGHLAGVNTVVELNCKDLQKNEKKVKEFLAFWAGLGTRTPPAVLSFAVLRWNQQSPSLDEAKELMLSAYAGAAGDVILVDPVKLLPCEPSDLEDWQACIEENGRMIHRLEYNRLKNSFTQEFRLADLKAQLDLIRIYS